MAIEFVTEDGTGKSDSTSYVTVDEMKQYWDNYGYDYSAITPDPGAFQILLNKSTRVIDNYYLKRWPGCRVTETQRLEWPRSSAYYVDGYTIDDDVIPVELKSAVCEMAYIDNSGVDLQPTVDPNGVAIVTEDKVSSLKEYREYLKSSVQSNGRSRLTAVEDALRRLISFGETVTRRV